MLPAHAPAACAELGPALGRALADGWCATAVLGLPVDRD